MKKIYLFLLFTLSILVVKAQEWSVYDADVLPNESVYQFSESNTGGSTPTNTSNTIIADAENPGNNLLELVVDSADSRFMWKFDFTVEPQNAITFVARIKGLRDTLDRVMEFDFQGAGFRERLYIKMDNSYELKESGIKGYMPGPMDWHIYRITKEGDAVKFFLDENPVPVAMGTTTTTSSSNYFRFGDGNGSSTLAALVDWVIWDSTGAFAPGEGEVIPDTLVQTIPSWTVFDGTVLPADFDPAFTVSNSSNNSETNTTNTIIPDPDSANNSLYELVVDSANSRYMWKHSFASDPQPAITWIARLRGVSDTLDRIMEIDLQQAGFRERLYIKNDNTFELKECGIKGDMPVNAMGWHIYRFTKVGDSVNFYIDENPEPFAYGTTGTTSGENYFRIGDGNGSSTLGGQVDWMIWDTTGAYAPDGGTFLPDSLIMYTQSSDASLSDLTADLGVLSPAFHTDSMSYVLEVPVGTASVTITATPTDDVYAVVDGDGIIIVPDTIMISVTAEDGFVMEYEVAIVESGKDASLSDLTSTVGTLNPAFSPEEFTYELRVPGSTASLTLTATPNDPNAVVSGDGEITVIPSEVTITVTAQEGNTQDYTVNITLMSSDATLSELSSNVGDLSPTFAPETNDYSLVVASGTSSIFITANTTDANATITGDGTFTDIPGTASIVVTAEDGTENTYTIDVSFPTATKENSDEVFSMYPNPVIDVLTLNLKSANNTVTVYNVVGQTVINKITDTKEARIDVSNLENGLYYIKINNGEESLLKQFIKQ